MAVPHARISHPRLAYVTPGHQFPLGVNMSLPRRCGAAEAGSRRPGVVRRPLRQGDVPLNAIGIRRDPRRPDRPFRGGEVDHHAARAVLDVAAARAAAARGVEVTPLSRYTRGRAVRQGLRLGFAAVDAREIRRGVRELAAALAGVSQ